VAVHLELGVLAEFGDVHGAFFSGDPAR